MTIAPAFRTLGRLIASVAFSFLLFLVAMLIPVGFTRLIWLLPGKAVAPILAAVVPKAWVNGDPTSENHWHVVSGGGFVILCGILFWAAVIFGLLHWRSLKKDATAIKGARVGLNR